MIAGVRAHGTRRLLVACMLTACQDVRSPAGVPPPRGDVARNSATSSDDAPEKVMTAEHPIPIEEVARFPLPGTAIPTAIRFTPDGEQLTYLASPDASLTQELFLHDPATGTTQPLFAPPEGGATEENLSAEEKLERERLRMRALGVTQYEWAHAANRFAVPLRGDVWVQDGRAASPRKLVDGDGSPALDARLSRDGSRLAYVWEGELHTVQVDAGSPIALTRETEAAGVTHGLAEYIAQEEMDRHHGYWWSYDGATIAFAEVDERRIPAYRIVHQGDPLRTYEDHGYPFAGAENAIVRLGIVPAHGGTITWLDLNATGIAPPERSDDLYLGRVHWMPDGTLIAEVENREQSRLHLIRYRLDGGDAELVLEERSDVWINLHRLFRPIERVDSPYAGGFVWGSERTGFLHLYLYDGRGQLVRPLTEGSWIVEGIEGIDETLGVVYFTGTKDGATERHLYRIALEGGPLEKLTTTPGMHGIVMDREATRFVDVHESLDQPPRITIHSVTSGLVESRVPVPEDPRIAALALRPPELVRVTTRDGVELHGAIYQPEGQGPFPTIVAVYGGPHAQRVQNAWSLTVDMRAQVLRSLGFLVFKLDNRGSARRGLAFEGALRHDMGNIEVQDQVDGVRWLVERGLAEPDRVGIYGWSYGGYMAAMALARAPETFKVAVAGAPVTHWDAYDTHYTERYMGTPQSNPDGYSRSSVMAHVDAMRGHLLIVHGLIDENVHFSHTARLLNALVTAGKPYDLLLFPNERHMPRAERDRVYMETRVRDFFLEHL